MKALRRRIFLHRTRTAMAIAVALLGPVFCSSGIAQAATVSFTYTIAGVSVTTGMPPVLSETFTGSGVVTPFGVAAYSDAGPLTLGGFPSGGFGAMLLNVNFVLSFNGGVDTFSGKEVVSFGAPDINGVQATMGTMTIDHGTGIFAGATGFGTGTSKSSPEPTPITLLGSGQITAPGLNAIPEPGTMALLSAGMVGLAGIAALRKRRRSS